MSLRTWLVLFIISMAFSAEVLAWAVQHGQFSNVNRGRRMPLRPPGETVPARRRPVMLGTILIGLAVMGLVWLDGIWKLLMQAAGR